MDERHRALYVDAMTRLYARRGKEPPPSWFSRCARCGREVASSSICEDEMCLKCSREVKNAKKEKAEG